ESKPDILPTNLLGPPNATVRLAVAGGAVEVKVELRGHPISKQARAGISSLQSGAFAAAVTQFRTAVGEKPANASYHFALAVAKEATGDCAGARVHYTAANRLTGAAGMREAQAGLKRLTAHCK